MTYLKKGVVAVAIIWLCAVLYGLFYALAPSDNSLGMTTDESKQIGSNREGSLGRTRDAILLEATRTYRDSHKDIPAEIASGKALAPVDYLNKELVRRGETWRVRDTEGLEANVYEISS